ncbi:helicase-associated domain-containing protein [Propionibacteriaceae bacterium Y1685]
MSRPASRTFTESLRSTSRGALVALLERRPDLTYPPPHGLADLAGRASAGTSVARAIGQLDAWTLTVLHALGAQDDPADVTTAADLLGSDPADVVRATGTLRDLALVWGQDDNLHLLRETRRALGPYPGGLAPHTRRDPSAEQAAAAIAGLTDEGRQVLDRLLWGTPTGVVRNAAQRRGDGTAIGDLLDAGLLVVHDEDTVIMPRTVAWALREPQRLVRDLPSVTAPRPGEPGRSPALVDRAAVGAAFECVHDVEAIAEVLAAGSHRVLADGGLGVRDLGQIAARLGHPVPRTAWLLECAHAAGLVNWAANRMLLPTTAFDSWVSGDTDDQWLALARGWLSARRWFPRSTDRGHHVLGQEASLRGAPEIRELVLACLTEASGLRIGPDDLSAALGWHRPAWQRNEQWPVSVMATEIWAELGILGLVALDGVSSLSAALLSTEPLSAELAELFPAPVTQVIVQADLTAVAPGPLRHDVAHELGLLADQESRGPGGVFRFSGSSLRRAFDAGWSHQEISTWLAAHSTTAIPQPLEYLVADTARLYGSVRVGHAWSYVRTEDETQATAILKHPDAGALGLRALAPGVLVAAAEPDDVVAVLRQLGLHPAAEDESGHTVQAPSPMRAGPVQPLDRPAHPSATETVAQLLAAEERSASAAASTEAVLDALVRAQRSGLSVEVSFVDADGSRSSTVAAPVTIGSGTVRFARSEGGPITVPLARISAAVVREGKSGTAR